jgi:tetratricopeptide (TPR) repeat protein
VLVVTTIAAMATGGYTIVAMATRGGALGGDLDSALVIFVVPVFAGGAGAFAIGCLILRAMNLSVLKKRRPGARQRQDEVVGTNERDAESHFERGNALVEAGKYAEACEHCARAVEIEPRDALAYYLWGLALARMGKRDEAEEKLSRAVELDPELKPQAEEMRKQLIGKN